MVIKHRIIDLPTRVDTDKKTSKNVIKDNIEELKIFQKTLCAEKKNSILIILQGMDTSGKDGIIRHVISGLNPQCIKVSSFEKPTNEELGYDFLWRCHNKIPSRGEIGIFNRSYYEDVLIAKVHNLPKKQPIPKEQLNDNLWINRYKDINNFEKHLYRNGYTILKFFINISKDEQKTRLLSRIHDKNKNWKLEKSDIEERKYWDDYIKSYDEMINHTDKKYAPWYIIPSDNKDYSRMMISNIILDKISKMNIKYPKSSNTKGKLLEYEKML